MLSSEDLVRRLALEVEQETAAGVGRRYGFAPSFLIRVVQGDERVSRRLAKAMGFERVVVFKRAEDVN